MSYAKGILTRAAGALCLLAASAAPVHAQLVVAEAPESTTFLSRYDFTLSAAALGYDDERFSWDTHWAGNFDMIDYRAGRITFLTDLQGLLGSEYRPFDPYQSNYLLEASGSVRLPKVEVALVLNHVSRHLGDRFKRVAVAENSLGLRALTRLELDPRTTIDLRADARKVIAQAFVDYTWMTEVDTTLRRSFNSHLGVFGRLRGDGITVDPEIAGRGFQYGGRAEVGVRLTGAHGAVDLFGGVERMIDADPLDRQPRRWAFFGFRIVGP